MLLRVLLHVFRQQCKWLAEGPWTADTAAEMCVSCCRGQRLCCSCPSLRLLQVTRQAAWPCPVIACARCPLSCPVMSCPTKPHPALHCPMLCCAAPCTALQCAALRLHCAVSHCTYCFEVLERLLEFSEHKVGITAPVVALRRKFTKQHAPIQQTAHACVCAACIYCAATTIACRMKSVKSAHAHEHCSEKVSGTSWVSGVGCCSYLCI